MAGVKALETDAGPRLAEFSRQLWRLRIPHRVFELPGGRQQIVVGNEVHAALVREHYARWVSGALDEAAAPPSSGPLRALALVRGSPVTVAAIILSLLGTAIVYLDDSLVLLRWLTFTDIGRHGGQLVFDGVRATYGRGEYWRLLSPVFLHFGVLHIAFNALWTWELGRRLEAARGSATLLAVLVLAGAGGNIAQYIAGQGLLFGGMSGVIYALLGYAWVWSRLRDDPLLRLPPGLTGFMVGWLLICMSGLVEALGFGAIANAAHAAGLLIGAALGLGAALLYSAPIDAAR